MTTNASASIPISSPPPIGLVGLRALPLDRHPAARVREVVAELEALGYPTLWTAEATYREILANSAMLLAATNRMTVAAGIANIWARDPMAMAAAQLTMSEAFDGRFLLGLGVSQAAIVEDMRGHVYAKPLATMSRYLDAMDTVIYEAPRPATPPARLLAAVGPKMLELATRKAAGAHPYMTVPEHTAAARQILGPDRLLCPEQFAVLETDPGLARRIARNTTEFYLQFANYRNELRKYGFTDDEFLNGGSDRLVDALVAWGDIDTIVGRVRQHHAAGADHVCLQVLSADPAVLPLRQWRELAPALLGG